MTRNRLGKPQVSQKTQVQIGDTQKYGISLINQSDKKILKKIAGHYCFQLI